MCVYVCFPCTATLKGTCSWEKTIFEGILVPLGFSLELGLGSDQINICYTFLTVKVRVRASDLYCSF